MKFDFLKKDPDNRFFPVSKEEIGDVEKELNLKIPSELVQFYNEIGYGFIKSSSNNINRLMDPLSLRDFRLRENDFELYPDIEAYEELEDGKLVFFEANESTLMLISFSNEDCGAIYYDEYKIADSLTEFLEKLTKNDCYYMDIVD
ncbi:SMI1/KNR4 family protein [Sporolactobacillus sp. CQH2019]|uniref:SMI1/KNR4 family protein n=1 Tax=Sporolactobacillus sp. CQH2019 TaxID=3023512 RepID=UPI0023682AC3|nr:SMI1/KNR4 family protein [Sporolactobacillus sp. CQH2019]MDD9149854.1 SMI1/KNR4 family protein [Sporolactobacillus sp. CQH2019]